MWRKYRPRHTAHENAWAVPITFDQPFRLEWTCALISTLEPSGLRLTRRILCSVFSMLLFLTCTYSWRAHIKAVRTIQPLISDHAAFHPSATSRRARWKAEVWNIIEPALHVFQSSAVCLTRQVYSGSLIHQRLKGRLIRIRIPVLLSLLHIYLLPFALTVSRFNQSMIRFTFHRVHNP